MPETMKAGRELDAEIAVRIMGFRRLTEREVARGIRFQPAPYSRDIASAWKVVEKMGLWVCPADDGHSWAAGKLSLEEPSPEGGTWADTAPHAICLAALAAIGKEEG